jgi:hypothetical protein
MILMNTWQALLGYGKPSLTLSGFHILTSNSEL